MTQSVAYLFSLSMLFAACSGSRSTSSMSVDPYNYTIQKKGTGTKGAVVSAHPLASEVGVAVMKQGGNAVDAAVATQLALAVVYPAAGNIGGGGFMILRKSDGAIFTLDYREKAPGAAARDMFLDETGEVKKGLSEKGHLSSGVPGSVAGMYE